MKHYIQHITLLCFGLLLASCVSELDGPQTNQQGTFSLGLSADSLSTEIVTRASENIDDYSVMLSEKGENIWALRYADIGDDDRIQPVGEGYVVEAENCTSAEAESLNEGWGRRRFYGRSETFAITKGQNTQVSVHCQMANAGLCVVFDESFSSYFTSGFAVTTDDLRALRFDADNQAQFDTNGQMTAGRVAYYNVNDEGQHTVQLIISGSAGWDGTLRLTRTLVLQQGRTYRLIVRKGEPQDGTLGVSISYDETFDDGTTEEVILE